MPKKGKADETKLVGAARFGRAKGTLKMGASASTHSSGGGSSGGRQAGRQRAVFDCRGRSSSGRALLLLLLLLPLLLLLVERASELPGCGAEGLAGPRTR
jgi:hypothetical protein